jgi:chromosome partitioning protein
MPILMLLNLKGGVAKTTNAVAIAECFASSGLRPLLIDADHQCMAGERVLGEVHLLRCDRSRRTLHDLLASMLDEDFAPHQFDAFVVKMAGLIGGGMEELSALPCSVRIDDFSTNMAKARRGHHSNDEFLRTWDRRRAQMKKWLQGAYDFTIIDCPPSLALQVKFLLSVADSFIVPCVPDRLSVRGSLYLLDRLERGGYRIYGLGTLWSLYREQNAMHRRIIDLAQRGEQNLNRLPRPFKTIIPNAARIAEATEPNFRPSSFHQKYTTQFARLYEHLCEEIIQRSEYQPAAANGQRVEVAAAN